MPEALYIPTMTYDRNARIAHVDMDSREPWDVENWKIGSIIGPDPADVLVWLDGDDRSDLRAFLEAGGNAETHKVVNGRIVPLDAQELAAIESAKLPQRKAEAVAAADEAMAAAVKAGFEYAGKRFKFDPLLVSVLASSSKLAYPYSVPTIDGLGHHDLADEAELDAFVAAHDEAYTQIHAEDAAAKKAIAAATSKEDLDVVGAIPIEVIP